MRLVCLPKAAVEKLKNAALANKVDLAKLYQMSSKERRDFFTSYTDKDLGTFLNVEFEKAMISKQKDAFTKYAKAVFTPEAKASPAFKTIVDKINNLDELGVLTPASEKAFLEDLVADKLGIRVTPEEVRFIHDKAQAIDKAQKALGEDLGNPTKLDENLAFFKAKKEMDDYLEGLNPASKLKVATGTIGRGMMLASVKSPILNIGSNIEVGATESLARRLSGSGFRITDNKLARQYVKLVNTVYQKTGYDLSRMTDLSDGGVSGERVLGDTVHAQGKGAIRKVGRAVEDVVFKQLMGAPDVAFGAAHFADSVNLNAFKYAKGDIPEAKKLMQDAMRIKPQTADGERLRAQAIVDAQVATWTNKSWATEVSLGVRKIVNKLSGNLRIGDYLFPFVKTPANVIATGLDYAGLGIPKALVKTVVAIRKGELQDRQVMQSAARDIVRAGLGIVGALAISNAIKPEDFVGAYDPNRAQVEALRNSNTNSVRIGGKWISLDWFGPLSVPMTSILYAKKYGTGKGGEMAWQYSQGAKSAAMNLPGIKDVTDYSKSQLYKKDQTGSEAVAEAKDTAASQVYSRLVPSILSDAANATDPYKRQTGKGIESIKSKIPGVRESLPIKKDVLGNNVRNEDGASTVLFGSRVRTDKETPVTKEVSRVATATDKTLNFTDWSKTTSKTITGFKAKVGGKKFQQASQEYGQNLNKRLERTIKSPTYQKLSDDDKLKVLAAQDTNATNDIFKKYHYKPPKSKSNRTLLSSFR